MLNNCVVVGKVVDKPVITKLKNGGTVAHMIVECDRSFRNEDGILPKDKFKVTLWKGIAEECANVCKEGSLVGIKGRLQSNVYEHDDNIYYNTEIIAERVSYDPRGYSLHPEQSV